MRVFEFRPSPQNLIIVARKSVRHNFRLALDHSIDLCRQLRHCGTLPPWSITAMAEVCLRIEAAHRFAKDFRRNGACLDADPSDTGLLLHDRDALAKLGCLNSGPLPRWSAANSHQIKFV